MSKLARPALVALWLVTGCKPGPLAAERAQCEALQKTGELRPGLTVDECARQLKETDPALRAGKLLERVAALAAGGEARQRTQAERDELVAALTELRGLGRPAVAPGFALLKGSTDPAVRLAVARALAGVCAEDCGRKQWDCIVPAILEGAAPEQAADVRAGALQSLGRCTGEPYGDDREAWLAWYAGRTTAAAR